MGGDIGAWEVPKGLGVGEEGAFLYSQGLGIIFNYHFLSFFFFLVLYWLKIVTSLITNCVSFWAYSM